MNADTILAALHAGALASLVTLAVDHALDLPLRDVLDPDRAARQVTAALRQAAARPATEAWVRDRVTALRGAVPTGTLGDRVPAEVSGPLLDVVARPLVPDRALIGRLVNHAAVEELLRDTVLRALRSFAERLRSPISSGDLRAGLGRLRGMRGVGEGLLGGLSHEIERQAEGRIQQVVDDAIQTVMTAFADHLCAPEHAARYGEYRAYLVQTVLSTDLSTLAAEADKLDPDHLVATGAAVARAVAARDGLEAEVRAVLASIVDLSGERRLRDLLAATGPDGTPVLDEATWRDPLEAQLAERAQAFVDTPGFRAWLTALLAG